MSRRGDFFPRRSSYPIMNFYLEGAVTEENYISDLKQCLLQSLNEDLRRRISANIKISNYHFQDSKSLVELALENKKDKDTSIVVIDEDERVSQKEINTRNAAIKKARKNDILFVYSIPCFEFWALLHFEYTSASLSRKECQKRLQKYLPEYNHKKKALVLDFSKLVNKQEQAITFAKRLISQHQNKLEGIDLENPTTNAFIIIEKIKEFIKSFPK